MYFSKYYIQTVFIPKPLCYIKKSKKAGMGILWFSLDAAKPVKTVSYKIKNEPLAVNQGTVSCTLEYHAYIFM